MAKPKWWMMLEARWGGLAKNRKPTGGYGLLLERSETGYKAFLLLESGGYLLLE